MRRFQFRLEALLKLHLAERDQCRLALADALAQAQLISQRLVAYDRVLWQLARERAAPPGAVEVHMLVAADRYAEALRRDRELCQARLTAAEQLVTGCHEKLLASDQQVRMFERLREKQLAQYLAAAERRDQRALDEVAAGRHGDPE